MFLIGYLDVTFQLDCKHDYDYEYELNQVYEDSSLLAALCAAMTL